MRFTSTFSQGADFPKGLHSTLCSDSSTASAGYMAVALGCAFTVLEALGIWVFRNDIGYLFVDDANVSREVAAVAPICAGYQVTDGIYGIASGVLK